MIRILVDILQKADFTYAESWILRGTFTFDVSTAVLDLGLQLTSIEAWIKKDAQWYQETTHVNDSPGYADHEKEKGLLFRTISRQHAFTSNLVLADKHGRTSAIPLQRTSTQT